MELQEGLLPWVVAAVFDFQQGCKNQKFEKPEWLEREYLKEEHPKEEGLALDLKNDELLAELVTVR